MSPWESGTGRGHWHQQSGGGGVAAFIIFWIFSSIAMMFLLYELGIDLTSGHIWAIIIGLFFLEFFVVLWLVDQVVPDVEKKESVSKEE